jgi:large subunit ribosomal protein L27
MTVKCGEVLIRQRGTKWHPGKNVGTGVDYTLFAMAAGKVKFSNRKMSNYAGKLQLRTFVSVVTE